MTVDEEIHQAADAGATKRTPIVIWGVGTLGQRVCEIFRGHALHVVGFVDGAVECGLPVAGPRQMANLRRGGALLVVASTWWRAIGVNLLNRGLRFGENFVPAQRQHSTRKWRRDAKEAVPLFVGRGTCGFQAVVPFFPRARLLAVGAFFALLENEAAAET